MALQYNMGPGQPMYSPSRDIAYLYPQIVSHVESQLYQGPFKELTGWLSDSSVNEDDLAETVRRYCLFLNNAHKEPNQSVEQCLDMVGWFEMPAQARVAVMFYLGAAMTGSIFGAVRDVTKQNDEPPHVRYLTEMGDRVAEYMNSGPWRRAFIRFKAKWSNQRRRTTD